MATTTPRGGPAAQAAAARIRALHRLRAGASIRNEGAVFRGIEHMREPAGFVEFASQQLRIVTRSGQLVPFTLNSTQLAIWDAENRARAAGRKPWFLILKSRKRGVTTLQQALSFWEIWRERYRVCRTYSHRTEDTRDIFRMVARFYDHQPRANRHRKTVAEVMLIEFRERECYYRAETAGAASSARGSTNSRIHLSEAAFYPALRQLHESVTEATTTDPAYIIETTPNGKVGHGEAFYQFWKTAKAGKNAFIPLFFPWHSDPANQIALAEPDELGELTDEEAKRQRRFNLGPEQLKWHRQKTLELMADGRSAGAMAQEHPDDDETCFRDGGNSYYDERLLDIAESQVRPWMPVSALPTDMPARLREMAEATHPGTGLPLLRIWELPQPDQRYVVGGDPSEGVGQDDCAGVGVNANTGEQAFSIQLNTMRPDEFGVLLSELGRYWAPKGSDRLALQVIEKQNHGHATITGMVRIANYPMDCIYHAVDATRHNADGSIVIDQRTAGWNNGVQGKIELTHAIATLLREQFPIIRDSETVRSLRAVSAAPNGGAEFTGRDLAVAVGLAAIGLPQAALNAGYAWIGGQLVNLSTGEVVTREEAEGTGPTDDDMEEFLRRR